MESVPSLASPESGVEVEAVTIDGAGVALEGIDARPTGVDTSTAILFIHENRGLVTYMREVVEALASLGHRVVAPDLLSRLGGTDRVPPDTTTRAIPVDTHVADLIAVADGLASERGVERWAVVGFCFGAEMGWHLVAHRVPAAGVLLYGIGPDSETSSRIRSPVYAVYAEDDQRVNSTVDATLQGLRRAPSRFVLESYPGTLHAFHDHHRLDRFHPDAAVRVWRRIIWFLERHLRDGQELGLPI